MSEQTKPPTMKGPPNWFTGDAWIDALASGHGEPMSVGNVHFSPGTRTAWHSHSTGQILYVTDGEGRVQARGEGVLAIHPGDTVSTPGGEWHWHGAAPDHFMTHLSITEGATEWGEHVTDAEYEQDPA